MAKKTPSRSERIKFKGSEWKEVSKIQFNVGGLPDLKYTDKRGEIHYFLSKTRLCSKCGQAVRG